uniref:IgGFc-binding protein n=1 Tax=Flavobacterium sp. TaxID=239 RepID=UPI00261651E2
MKIKLLLFVFLLNINAFCQFSKTHYIPPVSSSDNTEPQNQYLYISCPSLTPVNYKIIAIGGGITTGTVTRDVPVVFPIGFGNNTQMIISANDVNKVKNNKGYIVEAEDLVYVSVRMTATPQNNHAGSIVSKGLAALGTKFRIGAFLNLGAPALSTSHYTFAAILATENNTTVSFGDIHAGAVLINDAASGSTPGSVVLNSGETYVIATQGPNDANREALVGAFISSDKPIVVNCGSFAGSNSFTNNLDLGFDQIVSAEKTGKEYIFIKGNDLSDTEVPLIIADQDFTDVYINGNPSAAATLMAGEYFAFNGSNFSPDGNLYVNTTKKAFAYQAVGGQDNNGAPNPANQNMYFVPPLSCDTPKVINNIPYLNQVGNLNNFNGSVSIVTSFGATLDFIIDGNSYTLATLPSIGVQVNGPFSVVGNAAYQTYKFKGLTGNVSVFSSESVYLSYSGSSGAATYGGYYSGFTFSPEVAFNRVNIASDNCIPNVKLAINSLTAFNNFQWYFNGGPIIGATSNEYIPTQPGFYKVKAAILGCGSPIDSDEIPVSDCPTNIDGDLVNDNIDLDDDDNGISNCTESFGNQNINTAVVSGIVPQTTTTYTGTVTFSTPQAFTPFVGNPDGSIITQVRGGKGNYVAYNLNFNQPTSVSLEYVATASAGDLINADAEYVVNTDINKTITVLNPTNQLLIDTNYDGNYESGVTQFSSFEIRFRLNGNVPLP